MASQIYKPKSFCLSKQISTSRTGLKGSFSGQGKTIAKTKQTKEISESVNQPTTAGHIKWRWTKLVESQIFSVKISPDGKFLCAALADSTINVYSTITNELEFVLDPKMISPLPCT
jgi:WD40 repeat protein